MALCVVVHGSFGEGFEVVGPFKTEDLAFEWVEDNHGDDWWIVPLVSGNVKRKDNGRKNDSTRGLADGHPDS